MGHSTALSRSLIECLNECTTQPSLTNGFNHLFRAALAELAFASSPSLYLGKAKVGYEGIDLTGFTDLITTDRDFMIDMLFKDKYSDREVQRRKEVESYKQLVGKEDYYYSAKS